MHEIIMDHYLKPISYDPCGMGLIHGHTAPKLNKISLHQKYTGVLFWIRKEVIT